MNLSSISSRRYTGEIQKKFHTLSSVFISILPPGFFGSIHCLCRVHKPKHPSRLSLFQNACLIILYPEYSISQSLCSCPTQGKDWIYYPFIIPDSGQSPNKISFFFPPSFPSPQRLKRGLNIGPFFPLLFSSILFLFLSIFRQSARDFSICICCSRFAFRVSI